MSEHQYYEFQAIDRPLTEQDMAELRGISSRAEITPTRLTNVYHWGDFKGDPLVLMERYFDAFLYLANWGTHRLMFRLPRRLLDPETVSRYCPGDWAETHVRGEHVILEFHSENEEGDGEESGEGELASLIPLRAELASGDQRCLYLGWLLCAQSEFLDEDEVEPPVPAGLRQLSASLQAFADFLRIDQNLIAEAAERSATAAETEPESRELERWVRDLSPTEKDELLLRAVRGEGAHLRREQMAAHPGAGPQSAGRTVAQLLAAAEERAACRRREEAERAARERERQAKEAAAKRAAYLADLAKRQEETWRQIEALVESKRPSAYDEAVRLLVDLRDLAGDNGAGGRFTMRVRDLRERHSKKQAFADRLRRARLVQ